MVSSPEVAVGWYKHHSRMLQDQSFSASFEAWHSMDKQLHLQFIDDPFVVDPTCMTYSQLFERARMDGFLAHADKLQHGHSFHTNGSGHGGHQDSSSSDNGSHHYIPYDKEGDHGRTTDSFREG